MHDVARHLTAIGVPPSPHPEGGLVVRIPSTARGELPVHIRIGERTLTLRTFVMRAPDRAHDEVYRRMLRRNMDGGPWSFALDPLGDVHLVASLPAAEAGEERLDGVLGALAVLVDETFEGLARTGFAIPDGVSLTPPAAGPAQTSVDPKQRASV